jgi:hypothetical protein
VIPFYIVPNFIFMVSLHLSSPIRGYSKRNVLVKDVLVKDVAPDIVESGGFPASGL